MKKIVYSVFLSLFLISSSVGAEQVDPILTFRDKPALEKKISLTGSDEVTINKITYQHAQCLSDVSTQLSQSINLIDELQMKTATTCEPILKTLIQTFRYLDFSEQYIAGYVDVVRMQGMDMIAQYLFRLKFSKRS